MALVFHLARRFPGAASAGLQGTKWEISVCAAGASGAFLSPLFMATCSANLSAEWPGLV